jgi:hypothetical protein
MRKKTTDNSFDKESPAITNHRGGAFTFTNEHGKEKLNLSHIGGGHLEINPLQVAVFAPDNRTDVTNNDEFKTVKGDYTEYTGGTKSITAEGDIILTAGNAKAHLNDLVQSYYKKWAEMAEAFRAPDVKRPTTYIVAGLPMDEYPTDNGEVVTIKLNKSLELLSKNFCESMLSDSLNPLVLNDFIIDFDELFDQIRLALAALTGNTIQLITDLINALKQAAINAFLNLVVNLIADIKKMLASIICEFLAVPVQIVQFINNYMVVLSSAVKNILNPFLKVVPDSTEGNTYKSNDKSSLDQYIVQKQQEMHEIEQAMGTGGNVVNNILKNTTTSYGGFNYTTPVVFDKKGTEVVVGTYIDPWMGLVPLFGGIPLLTRSAVNDACSIGNHTLSVGNKYNIMTGGGGIEIGTLGPLDITTPLASIRGHGVEVDAMRVDIRGGDAIIFDSNTLVSIDAPSFVVQGDTHITKKLIVHDGAHINGEVYVNHISAPAEMQETMPDTGVVGYLTPGSTFTLKLVNPIVIGATTIPADQLFVFTVPPYVLPPIAHVTCSEHTHQFANVPLRLHKGTPIGTTTPLPSSDPLAININTAHSQFRTTVAEEMLSEDVASAYKLDHSNKWNTAV